MNKQEIINSMATKVGNTKVEAEKYLTALLETIEDAVKAGDEVNLVGYFKATVKQRAARTARNVKTGETVNVPAKKVVKIKVSPSLSKLAN